MTFTPPKSTGLFKPRVVPSNYKDYSELKKALELAKVCPNELEVEIYLYIYRSNLQFCFQMSVIGGEINITPVGLEVDPLVLNTEGTITEKPTKGFWVIENTSSLEEVFEKTLEPFL